MKCEAEIHSFYCKGEGKTRDHFTPSCIGKFDKLKSVNERHNFQYLDARCHSVKDQDTFERLRLRERQEAGEFISLAKYLKEFSFEIVHTTEWNEKELTNLLKTYCNRPEELAMILEEINFLSPTDLGL